MIEDLVQRLIDRLDHQYLGKYRGYVHAVEDPEGRGRIRAIVPRLLGESTPTGWAEPSAPYAGPDQGLFTVPDLGAGVWIEFEEGDLSKPIWTGCWWGAPTAEERDLPDNATRRATPETAAAGTGARTPETPQHEYPRESPEPKVRIFKSATGHHIVLDDRPESERIEIHDSKGNRLILSSEGLDRMILNERTYNKGNRSADIDGDDELDVAGAQVEKIGSSHNREVRGDAEIKVKGTYTESFGNDAYQRRYDHTGLSETVRGSKTANIQGGEVKSVAGAGNHTYAGGYGVSSAGPLNFTSAGPFKVGAAIADSGLNVISMGGGVGNVSINTMLGIMQLGGTTAFSPLVLGDGLAIHHTILAQALKLVNPPLVPLYGPVIDTWAAMTPVMDLSYFAFVKRFPVG